MNVFVYGVLAGVRPEPYGWLVLPLSLSNVVHRNRMSSSHFLITGASSGIGAALARRAAGPGIRLSLGGRDPARLSEVAAACRAAGAEVETCLIDVTDRSAVRAWIEEADRDRLLDTVIASAGISAGTGEGGESAEQARRILAVNIDGVVNTVEPAIDVMRPRRQGRIALMSSMAGFVGFPGAPAYCASKAAVRLWGEALRTDLRRDGIHVSVVLPGFVRTPMTAVNRFPMPMLTEPERAAQLILRGIDRGRGRIAFPLPLYLCIRLIDALPEKLRSPLLARAPRKPSQPG